MSERISIDAMALFTEECKKRGGNSVAHWFERNQADFEKVELLNLVQELLWSIATNNADKVLEDAAFELDEKYEFEYDEIFEGKPKKKFEVTFKEMSTQVVEIWAEDMDHAQAVANEMLDEIDMDKNPCDYDLFVDEIKEVFTEL